MTKHEFHQFYMNSMNTEYTVHGITLNPLTLGWTPTYGTTKRAIGRCCYNKNTGLKKIEISKHYLNIPNQNWDEMKDTVLHEIAHALDVELRGKTDHSEAWKKVARAVGANPQRTTDQVKVPERRYRLHCDIHGARGGFHRKPIKKRACGECCKQAGGGYHAEYLLDLIDTKTGRKVSYGEPRRSRRKSNDWFGF